MRLWSCVRQSGIYTTTAKKFLTFWRRFTFFQIDDLQNEIRALREEVMRLREQADRNAEQLVVADAHHEGNWID